MVVCCSIITTAGAQTFNLQLPSDRFFPVHCLHHTSFSVLPGIDYYLNSRGQLFSSGILKGTGDKGFLDLIVAERRQTNALGFQSNVTAFDFRKRTGSYELGFSLGLKSAVFMRSMTEIPEMEPYEKGPIPDNYHPRMRVSLNGFAAVAYTFSFLKNMSKAHLQGIGFKVDLLTGLNAFKGRINSRDVKVIDSNNVSVVMESRGYIARSKQTLEWKELIPMYNNPGISVSYGMRWQLSNAKSIAANILNFGFIYFKETHHYLAHRSDSLNLRYGNQVFKGYTDSLDQWSRNNRSIAYFIPFDLRLDYRYTIGSGRNLAMHLQYNPLLFNCRAGIAFNRTFKTTTVSPSLQLVNFRYLLPGLGLAKNGRHISWGIAMQYFRSTFNLYEQAANENVILQKQNNWQTTVYVYYHLINKCKRLTSKRHKLVRTFVTP